MPHRYTRRHGFKYAELNLLDCPKPSQPLFLTRALTGAAVTPHSKPSKRTMFSFSTRYSLAPKVKGTRLQLPAHKINNPRFVEPVLSFDHFERGPVFPSHFDNTTNVFTGKSD